MLREKFVIFFKCIRKIKNIEKANEYNINDMKKKDYQTKPEQNRRRESDLEAEI